MVSNTSANVLEHRRLTLQRELDNGRSREFRNRVGQFATPPSLASEILQYAASLISKQGEVAFLDPALGTGAFYSAFLRTFAATRRGRALGFEIDREIGHAAATLWRKQGLTVSIADFTLQKSSPEFDLIICNPPYVRHHHIGAEAKLGMQFRVAQSGVAKVGGLAGLYCYFMALSHGWLRAGGLSGWLVPSEFMDVNYGHDLKHYLLHRVTLLRIHRFDPSQVQFEDALVSSAVVWFRNEIPSANHSVEFTYGGSLSEPKLRRAVPSHELLRERKWTRFPTAPIRRSSSTPVLSDFFKITRGIATGDNSFFILDEAQLASSNLPRECFRPILPSPRYVNKDQIEADANGIPLLDRRLFLLDTCLSEDILRERFPQLFAYLQEGKKRGLHERYLCRHRKPWYAQEKRAVPPIVCTYLGRNKKTGRPFRFILNRSRATIANVYLAMYPMPILSQALGQRPHLLVEVWKVLNSISIDALLGEGRVYGGALYKLEPGELAKVPVPEMGKLVRPHSKQVDMFKQIAAE